MSIVSLRGSGVRGEQSKNQLLQKGIWGWAGHLGKTVFLQLSSPVIPGNLYF